MVMAETPFLVLLLGLLLLVDRWQDESRVLTWAGAGVILASAGLVWLKEAGIGVVVGLVVWLLLRGRLALWRKAVAVVAGTGILLLPVVVARLVAHVPVAGARYSRELGGYYQGGLADRLIHVTPHALWEMLSTALPATLVSYLSPLPIRGHYPDLWKVLSWHVAVLAVVGAVVWARRYCDAAIAIVPVYLAETLLWPYVNERRVILVLPILAAWYVLGAQAAWDGARWLARARRRRVRRRPAPGAVVGAALVAAAFVVGPLVAQLSRDYLLGYGQDTSRFNGSRYEQMLARLPPDRVETDYVSSTALFTGHYAVGLAFTETVKHCDPAVIRSSLQLEDAGFLLIGDLNKPGVIDSRCLLDAATSSPWAVRLLHTARDNASVFELFGPGTGHPQLRDLISAGVKSTSVDPGGRTVIEWNWLRPNEVSQVSVGEAGAPGATASVALQLRGGDGRWRTVASAPAAVGDGPGAAPFLLATLPSGTTGTALRVVIVNRAGGPLATSQVNANAANTVADVQAMGPGSDQ
jgi:hypothetical protein